jgi:hypothetical protein
MPAPFTTPVAQSVPFEANRNPGFGGVPSDLTSTNVQDAIEEAKNDALSNDRYVILGSYGANANAGRYLEFFAGIDSFEAPIILPVSTKLINFVAAASAVSNGSMAFFDLNVSSTIPVYIINYSGSDSVIGSGTPSSALAVFPPNAKLAIRVTNGSVLKPRIYFFLSSST